MDTPAPSRIRGLVTTLLALLAATMSYAQTPPNYRIVELPALEAHPNCPTNSNATAINELGDVVGVAKTSWYDFTCHFVLHAVIWRNGEIIDLGGIPPFDSGAFGKSINDNGETRGYLMTPVLFEGGFESGMTDGWSVVAVQPYTHAVRMSAKI